MIEDYIKYITLKRKELGVIASKETVITMIQWSVKNHQTQVKNM